MENPKFYMFRSDSGATLVLTPKLPEHPFYYYEDYFFMDGDAAEPTAETIYPTMKDLGKSHDRTSTWAWMKKRDGLVHRVRVYWMQFDLLPDEEFKQVGVIYVSNYGRVVKRFEGKKHNMRRCRPLVLQKTQPGYRQMPGHLVEQNHLNTAQMGALVLELFGPPRPSPDSVCLYIDHNPQNTHISNLKWGTRKESAKNNGRANHGYCKVRVVRGCRTQTLDPFIGQEFPSISALATAAGTSCMNIRQYIKNGKVKRV